MIVTPILSRYLSHFSILDRSKFLKIILEKNFHHFLPTSSQIPPSFTRITKFPLPSNIEERHSRIAQRKAVFERLEIKETIYFDTAMDWSTPHVPHRPPSPAIRGNDGSLCTCERNTRASSVAKRFWHGSSLVSPRANFSKAKRSYYY